jgi:hypothetical protein
MLKCTCIALALSAAVIGSASAATYWEALSICSKEWAERPDKATNFGGAAWQEFRARCVAEKGYVKSARRR